MSDSRISWSACTISATRAASRSLSPKRISAVATVSFSLITGMQPQGQQRVEGRARVQVAAAVLGVVQRQQQLRSGQAVRRQAPRVQACARRICPTAAAACFSSSLRRFWVRPSVRRASAMAPEDTTMTSVPRSRERARCRRRRCPARPCAAPPASSSTTSALPILTTIRWRPAIEGARKRSRGLLPLRLARAVDGILQRRAESPARPGRSRRTADRPAARTLCAARPAARRFRAASWHRTCSGR